MIRLLAALAIAMPVAAAEAEPARTPSTAAELFDALARLPGLRADYREEKHMTVLVEPVISEGKILFSPPSKLVRVTTKPIWSSVVVDEKGLVYRDAAGVQKLPAGEGDRARSFVEVFVGVARGDRKSLEKRFRIRFTRAGSRWKVVLLPKQKDLGIRRIELGGAGYAIETMQIDDASGDRTELTFRAIDTSRAPTRRELEQAIRPLK